MPAPTENIGIVAIIIALMVGEPVSFSPYVSQMKYMNGSQNESRRNFGRSALCIPLILELAVLNKNRMIPAISILTNTK